MPKLTVFFIASLLLLFATVGIVFTDNSSMHNNYNINIQSLSVLALALLSIGIFFENNKTKFVGFWGQWFYKYLGQVCLVLFGALLFSIEIILLASRGGIFNTPLCMAALAIGLYLTNRVINQ
jgi:hypothetical protein